MQRYLLTKIIICFAILISSVYAGNYGKIIGQVTDKKTGEPLPGVNVYIENTTLGAASDVEGTFIILRVPPGEYSLRADYIGYNPVIVRNIEVRADRISYTQIDMQEAIMEAEEVVVFAERPVVEKDIAATTRSVGAKDIEALPVNTVSDVIRTQPGVISSGGLHLRGGRSGEVVYYVDGVPLVNPLFSEINSSEMINKDAISEMQVISGTYSAEYGNAMSGIINITTRGGSQRFNGNIDVKSSLLGLESYSRENNRNVFRASLSGPVFKKMNFFVSGNYDRRDSYLPWGYNRDGSFFFKLTDQSLDNLNFSLSVNLSQGQHKNYSHSYKYIPDQYWYEPRTNSQMYRFGLTHVLAANLYYSLSLFHTNYHYDSGDFDYRDLRVDYAWDANHEFYTLNYVGSFSDDDQRTTGLKGDIVWRANNYNEFKAGIIAKYHSIDRFYISAPYYDNHTFEDYNVNPVETGAYIQDKINFSSIILSAGLRFDMHAPNTDYWENPYDVDDVSDSTAARRQKSSNIHTQISPRLAISYPVTSSTVFHFGYGHYFQRPEYQFIYRGLVTYEQDTSGMQVPKGSKPDLYDVDEDGDIDYKDNLLMALLGGGGRFGNPDLKPEKTVAYEFGVSQQLFDDYVLDVTVYSKQITNLLGVRTYFAGDRPEYWETFTLHINEDFAYNNGFEIQLRKIRGHYFTGEINYTYAVAEGSSSGPLERWGSEEVNKQTLKFFPLSFDQRHTINGRFTFRWGNFRSTLIGDWGSGLPYTIEMRSVTDPYEINNGRMPETWSLDLKMDYTFNAGLFNLVPYLEVYNLTNRRNVRYVYGRTGQAGFSDTGKTAEFDRDPRNWGAPRLIYLGFKASF